MVRRIRAETARRKRIWRLMRAAGYEAVQAVRVHARSRGVITLDWFKYDNLAKNVYVYYQTGSQSSVRFFQLRSDGRVLNDDLKDATYEGYPALTKEDPAAFKKAAVEVLMRSLNKYCRQQREQRQRRARRR